jgi:hypothetical protein
MIRAFICFCLLSFIPLVGLSAQSQDVHELLPVADALQIGVGIATAGFGIWHYFVPSAFGWWDHFNQAPPELEKAVAATNFFFSTSMTIIGLTSIIVPAVFPEAQDFNTAWLWMLSGLWTARSVYQIVAPQGTEIHGVSEVMTTSFLVINAMVIFSAIVNTL